MKTICLFGVGGSGKTSTLDMLAKELCAHRDSVIKYSF